MTVGELKQLLNMIDDNIPIFLSNDSEGNGVSKTDNTYFIGSYKDGKIGLKELNDRYIEMGYTEEDVVKDGIEVLLLYPED